MPNILIDTTKLDEISKKISDLVVTNSMLQQLIDGNLELVAMKKKMEDIYLSYSRAVQDIQDLNMNIRLSKLENVLSDISFQTITNAEKMKKNLEIDILNKDIKIDISIFEIIKPAIKFILDFIVTKLKSDSSIDFIATQDSAKMSFNIIYKSNLDFDKDLFLSNLNNIINNLDISINSSSDKVTFSIVVPLSMAILDGLDIRVGKNIYIVPTTNLVESLQAKQDEIKSIGDKSKSLLMLRDEFIPILKLYEYLNVTPDNTDYLKGIFLVIKNKENLKVALFIDEFLKQEKVVLKSIEDNFIEIKEISGSTIRGDGRIGLILDIESLFQVASSIKY